MNSRKMDFDASYEQESELELHFSCDSYQTLDNRCDRNY